MCTVPYPLTSVLRAYYIASRLLQSENGDKVLRTSAKQHSHLVHLLFLSGNKMGTAMVFLICPLSRGDKLGCSSDTLHEKTLREQGRLK